MAKYKADKTCRTEEDLIKHFEIMSFKPKVVVFDLDYTLWPFWIDTHVNPPFRKTKKLKKDVIVDSSNDIVKHYDDVLVILKTLKYLNIKISIASRTTEYNAAIQLIKLFDWYDYFDSIQIYPGCKIDHIDKICNDLDIEHKHDVLFFDDKHRNIFDTKSVGVHAYLVNDGVRIKSIIEGLNMFNKSKLNNKQ